MRHNMNETYVDWTLKLEVEKKFLEHEIDTMKAITDPPEDELDEKLGRLANLNALLDEVIVNQELRA